MTTASDPRVLAFDGGGTKTRAALADTRGGVLASAEGGPMNPTSVPPDALRETLAGLLRALGLTGGEPLAAVFGGFGGALEGAGQRTMETLLRDALPNARRVKATSDLVCALASGVGAGDGMVAIAGTGSSVLVRAGGEAVRVGGWGYLLGDEGSGFDLGQRALKAVLRHRDGVGTDDASALAARCAATLGKPVWDAVADLYEGGRALLATFAPVLLDAAQAGDAAAAREARAAFEGLARTVDAGARRFPNGKPPALVLAGGLWSHPFYRALAQARFSGYETVYPKKQPIDGAVSEAVAMAQDQDDQDVETMPTPFIPNP